VPVVASSEHAPIAECPITTDPTDLLHTDAHGRPAGMRIGPPAALCKRPIAVARLEPLDAHR
jgi:hypothetical protein